MYACIHLTCGLTRSDSSTGARLATLAQAFSPKVEIVSAQSAAFDIAPLTRLFGGPAKIASEIAREAHKMKLEGNIGIAANPDTAILAAVNMPGVTIVPPGRESEILGGLRLSALSADPETIEVLHRWGIRTLGQFCDLPEDGVAERLGPRGLDLLRLARGERLRPIKPDRETTSYRDSVALEHPVALLEPLMLLLARMVNELCERMRSQSMATTELRLGLDLENKTGHSRVLRLPFATRDAKSLLKLLQLDLEAHPPAAPIVSMALEVEPVEPRVVQNDLYTPPRPEPEKLELTLEKIRGMVGSSNAGSPHLLDTHRRDAWKMLPRPPGQTQVVAREPRARVQLAFRYWRPPVSARVEVADGLPCHVQSRMVRGCVERAAGPWRGSGDWWNQHAWDREEWDIGLDGALYRLVRIIPAREWILEGAYD